jgi:hypothetical protein
MRTHLILLLLVPFLLQAQIGTQPAADQSSGQLQTEAQSQETPDDLKTNLEEGIKHLLLSQIEAWNHGKLDGFMQGYWHSPDLTFFSGSTVTKGWEPTLLRYRQRYQSEGKEMGKLEFQDLNIDLLSRRAAVVTGKWQLTMSTSKMSTSKTSTGKTPEGKQPHGLFTLVLKRMPAGWRIVHDHTSAAAE